GDEVFVLSFDRPDRNYFTMNNSHVVLTGSITTVLTKIAYGYYLLTGRELEVTSGLRTADEQAREMRKKAQYGEVRFLGLYIRHNLAEKIWEAYDKAHKAGAGEDGEVEAITAVIREQVNKGEDVSKHLSGSAFDVRNRTMNSCERDSFEAVVKEVLGSADSSHLLKNEPGEPHFHVQFDR
ncbi:MAG TPA: hypothetical protein VNF29_05165, partial [Candidatus Binataceae bacterium]|nr:hypothetical protein [Candidatus Binataceae bacterium]